MMLAPMAAQAQDFGALAHAVPEQSAIEDGWFGKTTLSLELTGGVPWRVFTVNEPDRLVLDFREVAFGALDLNAFDQSDKITAVYAGPLRAGWSRMVIELAEPLAVAEAGLAIHDDGASINLDLRAATRAAFDAKAGIPDSPSWVQENAVLTATPRENRDNLVVVIDPGHGGIDPGATRKGFEEADLVLQLALDLEEALLREGRFAPVLTRREDAFVSLERRVAIAAEAQADLFLSLHADAVEAGVAQGAAVFTLSDEASDAASLALVERHERQNLLLGVDLSGADDEIAQVLLEMARHDTTQRSAILAEAVAGGLQNQGIAMHKKPIQKAGFSVLKSADIPSVLVEAGFLSTDAELERLTDPAWRAQMAAGIRDGLQAWILADDTLAPLRRK